MASISTVRRLIATSDDLDATGLQIIGYYLRLYAIEQILSEQERSRELTELATQLLTNVEEYKSSIPSPGETEAKNPVYVLMHDEEKAKTYMMNFSMSLYNGKLKQVQEGPWDLTLTRGLWCCIDLFSCILHLWGDDNGSLKKRLKYCKLYLSKAVKGELGPQKKEDEEKETVPDTQIEHTVENHSEPLDYTDFLDGEPQDNVPEDEITDMLRKLRAADEDETGESNESNEANEANEANDEIEGTPQMSKLLAAQVPKSDPYISDEAAIQSEDESNPDGADHLPKFVDSEQETDVMQPEPEPMESKNKPTDHHKYTQENLHSIMERSGQIEKVQKMAKYAISALNYEDIATARDELTNALKILDSL